LIIEQRITIAAAQERVWDFMMDVPAVSRCVPGVESVTPLDDGTFVGVLLVKVGPVRARLEGKLTLAERDRDSWLARMDVQAADRRIGGMVTAKMTMRLTRLADDQTDLAVHTDAAVLGKLGQFGQAVIKRQADQLMAEFARNVSRTLDPSNGESR
jgi:carbon monoxide dehydrogenase subunit G